MENAKDTEVFVDIKGYPGYQISNMGRVWSCKRNKYMIPQLNNRGYSQIKLIAANGKRKGELVHRLVALHFVPNPEGKPEVNHKNHIRDDNRAENLEWLTKSENNSDKLPYKHSDNWHIKRQLNSNK